MKIMLHFLALWALLCPAQAHRFKTSGHGYDGGHGDHDDEDGNCFPYPPDTTITTTSTTTSLAASCTWTGTQTWYSSSGCGGLTCSTGFCIRDAAATKSCGCDRLEFVTKTITVCPTTTPCYQCTTGWGTFIQTESCTSTPPPPLAT